MVQCGRDTVGSVVVNNSSENHIVDNCKYNIINVIRTYLVN